jgi:hypothetical protein
LACSPESLKALFSTSVVLVGIHQNEIRDLERKEFEFNPFFIADRRSISNA